MRIPIYQPMVDRAPSKASPLVAHTRSEGLVQQADWLKCSACCAGKAGFVACVARCLATGQACDGGVDNCTPC